jgi:hypothetical protein
MKHIKLFENISLNFNDYLSNLNKYKITIREFEENFFQESEINKYDLETIKQILPYSDSNSLFSIKSKSEVIYVYSDYYKNDSYYYIFIEINIDNKKYELYLKCDQLTELKKCLIFLKKIFNLIEDLIELINYLQ